LAWRILGDREISRIFSSLLPLLIQILDPTVDYDLEGLSGRSRMMQLDHSQPITGQPIEMTVLSSRQADPHRTIYPFCAYSIQGLALWQGQLLALDAVRGYLLQVDPLTESTVVLNSQNTEPFVDAMGLAVWEDSLWFARDNTVYQCSLTDPDFAPHPFVTLPYPVDGVGVWESTVYVSSQKKGYIMIYERTLKRLITQFAAPGVGPESLMIQDEELWVSDRIEQTVYCLDRATGEQKFCVLTPFEQPTGLAFYPRATDGPSDKATLYVAYAGEEPYIRDNPNADDPFELTYRDRTFIHPLHIYHNAQDHYALSNGYLVEMSYVEELQPLEDFTLTGVEWRIALPAETHRQKICRIEAIGHPFIEEFEDGERVAVFKFDQLTHQSRHVFGWKALIEVRGIKYLLQPEDTDGIPPLPPSYQTRYLIDDDQLAMDTPIIKQAAREAIGTETNLLRRMLKIRNYVYDKLSYRLTASIAAPDVVLERGIGSCGEYVGLLLALTRLNGIACRTVGRYKCPAHADQHHVPLQPDYNHVWLEFYIPGYGWLPMESNPDDIVERGPYPTRFFMGLPWYHAEIGKGIPFETVRTANNSVGFSIGELAINHVRFRILGELPPMAG
jgi:transglutaminase-like putative cysteine protease